MGLVSPATEPSDVDRLFGEAINNLFP
jgi:hypothetical protein